MPSNTDTPAPDGQAAVRASEKLLEEKTRIPDGPNVAPSPQEHLAAQGLLTDPASTTASSPLPPSRNSPGNDPVEAIDPAEQPLVDEQLSRDSAAARQTDPVPPRRKADPD